MFGIICYNYLISSNKLSILLNDVNKLLVLYRTFINLLYIPSKAATTARGTTAEGGVTCLEPEARLEQGGLSRRGRGVRRKYKERRRRLLELFLGVRKR